MKFIYPVVIEKVDEKEYKGYFPDLAECYARGETLEDVLESAREAAREWIAVEMDDPEGMLPPATEEEKLVHKENEEVHSILVNIRGVEGWAEYQPIRPV